MCFGMIRLWHAGAGIMELVVSSGPDTVASRLRALMRDHDEENIRRLGFRLAEFEGRGGDVPKRAEEFRRRLHDWRAGKRAPSVTNARLLARYFNVDPEFLVAVRPQPQPAPDWADLLVEVRAISARLERLEQLLAPQGRPPLS